MSNNIPTAEEIAKKVFPNDVESGFQFDSFNNTTKNLIKKSMIEFAKLHVKAALKEASKKVKTYNTCDIDLFWSCIKYIKVDKDTIKKAYPENLIQ